MSEARTNLFDLTRERLLHIFEAFDELSADKAAGLVSYPNFRKSLRDAGLDIKDNPTSQRELKLIQAGFDWWHQETDLPYSHLSRIAAMSVG